MQGCRRQLDRETTDLRAPWAVVYAGVPKLKVRRQVAYDPFGRVTRTIVLPSHKEPHQLSKQLKADLSKGSSAGGLSPQFLRGESCRNEAAQRQHSRGLIISTEVNAV